MAFGANYGRDSGFRQNDGVGGEVDVRDSKLGKLYEFSIDRDRLTASAHKRSHTVKGAQLPSLQSLIREQLRYFETEAQRKTFFASAVEPFAVKQLWAYGDDEHTCFVVAQNAAEQIVYCNTGFGPAFPWSVQRIGTTDLGTDGQRYVPNRV